MRAHVVRSATYSFSSFFPERFFGWFVPCAQVSFSTGAESSTVDGTLSTRHLLFTTTLVVARLVPALVLVLARVLVLASALALHLELRVAVQERDLQRRPLLLPLLPPKRRLSYPTRLELAA